MRGRGSDCNTVSTRFAETGIYYADVRGMIRRVVPGQCLKSQWAVGRGMFQNSQWEYTVIAFPGWLNTVLPKLHEHCYSLTQTAIHGPLEKCTFCSCTPCFSVTMQTIDIL